MYVWRIVLLTGLIERNAGDGLRSYYSQLGELIDLYYLAY